MKKGITVDQTALVAAGFKDAGIMIHAYLMYGCPSETVQETIDSHERIRQLLAADLIQSAFWHRFTVTAHSPIGLDPGAHGLRILGPTHQGFAENDREHEDRCGETPAWLGEGLRRSLLNYLERRGLDLDVRFWFDEKVPRPRVSSRWLTGLLTKQPIDEGTTRERRLVWLGGNVTSESVGKRSRLILRGTQHDQILMLPTSQVQWLTQLLSAATPQQPSQTYPHMRDAGKGFPGTASSYDRFLTSQAWKQIRATGLVLV